DLLAALTGEIGVEGDLLHLRYELGQRTLFGDPDTGVGDVELQALRGQRADEVDLLGLGADVGEAARPADAALEGVDVDVAGSVDLGKRETGHVESTAVVEAEHVRLV